MSRIEKLRRWMAENDLGFSAIAQRANCSVQHACNVLHREEVSQKVAARFIGIGIPTDLLPRITDVKLGRRAKTGTLPEAGQ